MRTPGQVRDMCFDLSISARRQGLAVYLDRVVGGVYRVLLTQQDQSSLTPFGPMDGTLQ